MEFIKRKPIIKSLFSIKNFNKIKVKIKFMADILYLNGKAVGVRKNENSVEYYFSSDYDRNYLSQSIGSLKKKYENKYKPANPLYLYGESNINDKIFTER